MNSQHAHERREITRRGFLKLATGTVAGMALIQMPSFNPVQAAAGASRSLKPVHYGVIPANPIQAAKSSALVKAGYDRIVEMVQSINDNSLRKNVLSLINDPVPTFMQEYTSDLPIQQLYSQLASQGLIDTSKISAAHLLPPFAGKSPQPFLTAPGSGYGSHHNYPGGLMTHVSTNLHITNDICKTYEDVFYYEVHRDIAIAGQALHDIEKPFVFQWQNDGSSLKEYTIAGQGAHHVISLAEVIYRGFPPEEVVAQACAHGAPSSAKDEGEVVGWLKAAAMMAHKDPIAYGLLNSSGDGLPSPHHQEGYIVHLGDHDWVLSVPAAQKTVAVLKKIAAQDYGMEKGDLDGLKFNSFRNYIGAQLSFMYLNMLNAEPDGYNQVRKAVAAVILK